MSYLEKIKCYGILGINVGSSEDEIKKAYKKLALLYHPDKNESDDAKEKFQEIGYAYKFLTEGVSSFQVNRGFNDVRDDFFQRMFEEMFFPSFTNRRFFNFFMDSDESFYGSERTDDASYSQANYTYNTRNSGTLPNPNRDAYMKEQQRRKQEKEQRQKEKADERKKHDHAHQKQTDRTANSQQNPPAYSENINNCQSSDQNKATRKDLNADYGTNVDYSNTASSTENTTRPATPIQRPQHKKLTQKDKKKLESNQRKREQEMKAIAEELLRKQEREREKQLEKERQAAQKKEQDVENEELHFYDFGKKSRNAKKREKRRQEATNLPEPVINVEDNAGNQNSRSNITTDDRSGVNTDNKSSVQSGVEYHCNVSPTAAGHQNPCKTFQHYISHSRISTNENQEFEKGCANKEQAPYNSSINYSNDHVTDEPCPNVNMGGMPSDTGKFDKKINNDRVKGGNCKIRGMVFQNKSFQKKGINRKTGINFKDEQHSDLEGFKPPNNMNNVSSYNIKKQCCMSFGVRGLDNNVKEEGNGHDVNDNDQSEDTFQFTRCYSASNRPKSSESPAKNVETCVYINNGVHPSKSKGYGPAGLCQPVHGDPSERLQHSSQSNRGGQAFRQGLSNEGGGHPAQDHHFETHGFEGQCRHPTKEHPEYSLSHQQKTLSKEIFYSKKSKENQSTNLQRDQDTHKADTVTKNILKENTVQGSFGYSYQKSNPQMLLNNTTSYYSKSETWTHGNHDNTSSDGNTLHVNSTAASKGDQNSDSRFLCRDLNFDVVSGGASGENTNLPNRQKETSYDSDPYRNYSSSDGSLDSIDDFSIIDMGPVISLSSSEMHHLGYELLSKDKLGIPKEMLNDQTKYYYK